MKKKKYLAQITDYEENFQKYGDSYLTLYWPKKEDVDLRYQIMLEVIRPLTNHSIELLDFGCGLSHLYDYIIRHNLIDKIKYSGLDISEKFIQVSKNKYPNINYYCQDILERQTGLPNFDYVIMNGVFTAKEDMSFDEMFDYFKLVLSRVYDKTRAGFAFNVMSKLVDWEREDLFHLPFDVLTAFLTKYISRNFIIRHDYGLYEYTVYVYR